jgi:ribonuclease Z
MIEITLLGTGSPIPDPVRAGPSTLVRAGGQLLLVDCGRGCCSAPPPSASAPTR